VGFIVAFFAIAAFYVWPDKKWIGWSCLLIAAGLVIWWAALEVKESGWHFRSPITRSMPVDIVEEAHRKKHLTELAQKSAYPAGSRLQEVLNLSDLTELRRSS
jgi:hypothetical protein